jgi:mRNA interferase RelE/StbE
LKVEFKSSFLKDLKKIRSARIKSLVTEIIDLAERVKSAQEFEGLKKLRGKENYYRLRIGDYRIGLKIEADTILFVRLLHRKDLYRYFP